MTPYVIAGLAAAGLEAIFVAMLRLGNLKAHAVEFIALHLSASLLYLVAVWAAERFQPRGRAFVAMIFIAGLAFRATLFPLYPSLSDDLLRYRWEARAQAAGVNTYVTRPDAPQVQFLHDETWPGVNGKEFTTAYGPLTELVLRAGWLIASRATSVWSVLLMKLPALAFDLACAALLVILLARMRIPVSRVIVYYWCPVAIVEFAASGHNDSIAVFFLLLALVLAEYWRPPMALASLAASALAKVFAVFLAPVLIVREWRCFTGRGGRALLWPVALTAIVAWPFRSSIPRFTLALAIGSGHWRNNDSLFGIVSAATTLSVASWIYMATVAATSAILAWRRVELVRAAFILLGVILAGAANCFPWYLTWILPLLAIFPNPAWLLLTALSALAYQVLIGYGTLGIWRDSDFLRALEYVPFYALLMGTYLMGLRRRAKE